jgi:PhnB protein
MLVMERPPDLTDDQIAAAQHGGAAELAPQVAVLSILGCRVGVATESTELRTPSPETVGGTTVRIHLYVNSPDELVVRAIAAGAEEMVPVADQPYGLRQGRVVDPFGHHWLISRALRTPQP